MVTNDLCITSMFHSLDSPPEPAFSTRILIGIGILVAIAIPGIICVIFKYMKVRRWSKRQDEGEEELTTGSLQPLRRFPIGTSSESTNRYSSMPTGEGPSTPTHTHTCIIGKHFICLVLVPNEPAHEIMVLFVLHKLIL